MEVQGLRDALAALDAVEKKVKTKLLRKAATAGGKIVLRAVKARVARKSGLLARAMGHKTKAYTNTGTVIDIVGPRKGFAETTNGKKRDPAKYAHLVEDGTRPHSVASGSMLARRGKADVGQGVGAMHPGAKPKPFMAPARMANAAEVIGTMTQVLADGIEALGKGGEG